MRLTTIIALVALVACGKKAPPEAAAEPAPAAPAAPVAPEPPPEPAAPPPPEVVRNADFTATLTYADGRTVSGKVVTVERADDFYGDEGWLTEDRKTILYATSGGQEAEYTWKDVKSITVKPGSVNNLDCFYDREFQPWMYECTVDTTGTMVTTGGKTTTVNVRNKWRFTFENGDTAEFYLYKYPVRKQEEATRGLDDDGEPNVQMYVDLQGQAAQEVKKDLVTKIVLTH